MEGNMSFEKDFFEALKLPKEKKIIREICGIEKEKEDIPKELQKKAFLDS